MCAEPRILLLDDPFSGLDNQQVSCLVKVLNEYRERGIALGQKRLICYTASTHEEANLISDRIILLKDGIL